jgi:nucleoside-diphosphate-sugar epimerase
MILLTGGTGFLGQYILRDLLHKGERVKMLVRDPSKVQPQEGLEVVEGDVLDHSSLETAFEGVDRVIHAAAVVSFWPRRKAEMMEINVQGTANLVDFALDANVDKFIHVSSIAALGRVAGANQLDEQSKWVNSKLNSNYAISKYRAELEVHRGVQEGLPAAIVNPGVILGAGNWNTGSPKLFKTVFDGLKFYNAGANGFVCVEDVSRATIALLESDIKLGERFILVSDNLTWKEALTLIAESMGVKAPSMLPPGFLVRFVGAMSERLGNLRNKEPLITKETARSSKESFSYDGSKITKAVDFQYGSIRDCIKETGKQFLAEHGNHR